MKVILAIIVALVACAFAEEWTVKTKKERRQISADCAKEVHLSEKEIAQVLNMQFPNEEPIRQFVLCKAKKNGIFATDKGFIVERIVAQYNPGYSQEKATDFVKNCIDKHQTDGKSDGQSVYEVYLCLLKKVHDFKKQKLTKRTC